MIDPHCDCKDCRRTRYLIKILPYAALIELILFLLLTIYVTSHPPSGR